MSRVQAGVYPALVTAAETPLRDLLRQLPVFAGAPEEALDVEALPVNPLQALEAELRRAIKGGEPEPHAMTLSTVSAAHAPSSRVLLCKDVDRTALYFATSRRSRKGHELANNESAAASFYWRISGRQFRLVGRVVAQDEALSAADFADRSRESQVAALVRRDVAPTSRQEVLDLAASMAASTPDDASAQPDWTVYALIPEEAELWQARRDRLHDRVAWTKVPEGWRRGLLWP